MKNHYVDNKKIYAELKAWKDEMKETGVMGPIPEYVAISIIRISENLSRLYNFSGYTTTWKEEMIGDAIEHCTRYIKNFDTDKYNNPHAYITRICYRAFIQRIKKERKDTAIKYKVFLCDSSNYTVDGEDADFEFLQQMLERVDAYETSKDTNKVDVEEKKEPLNLQKFYN